MLLHLNTLANYGNIHRAVNQSQRFRWRQQLFPHRKSNQQLVKPFEITVEIMREKLGEATGASVIARKGLDGANNYFPPFLSSLPQVALLCCCYVATANFPLNLMQHSTSRGQNSASLPVATSKLPAAEHFTFSIFLVTSFFIR